MTDNREMYFFEARVYRLDKQHWTVGIKLSAPDLEDASRTFLAWSRGVMVHPKCARIGIEQVNVTVGMMNKGYLYVSDEALQTEIQLFLGKDYDDAS